MNKFWQFLLSNFQIVNFFLASVIIGGLFGFWYLPQSTKKEVTSTPSKMVENPPVETPPSLTNTPNTTPESPAIIPNPPPETSVNANPPVNVKMEEKTTPPLTKSPPMEETIATNTVKPPLSPKQESQELANLNYLLSSTYFGHFPFQEAPQERLMNMGKYYNRIEYLDREAGEAFLRMKADAKAQGVDLVLISGFRSISAQNQLFEKQIQKRGSKEEAVKLSAPPGHSEHHTGYALDIGDGKQPSFDLKFQFENTQAYRWLVNNAHKYGFELSFPQNNLQGVSFEPWHWRFVASDRANTIFAMPRNLFYMQK